jgi:lipopolysaccharide biosynthesis glycosyltransferase
MNKNIILTYSTNQTDLTSLTYPFLERYCESHNIDLCILRNHKEHILKKCENDGGKWFVGLDRFYTYDLLDTYDNVLWLGSDVLVCPGSPNIFTEFPDAELGVFCEGTRTFRPELVQDCYNAHGELPEVYFNIDVMLVNKKARDIYNYTDIDFNDINKGKWQDQDFLNYKAYRDKFNITDMGIKWNCMISLFGWDINKIPADANFIHITGMPQEPRYEWLYNFVKSRDYI